MSARAFASAACAKLAAADACAAIALSTRKGSREEWEREVCDEAFELLRLSLRVDVSSPVSRSTDSDDVVPSFNETAVRGGNESRLGLERDLERERDRSRSRATEASVAKLEFLRLRPTFGLVLRPSRARAGDCSCEVTTVPFSVVSSACVPRTGDTDGRGTLAEMLDRLPRRRPGEGSGGDALGDGGTVGDGDGRGVFLPSGGAKPPELTSSTRPRDKRLAFALGVGGLGGCFDTSSCVALAPRASRSRLAVTLPPLPNGPHITDAMLLRRCLRPDFAAMRDALVTATLLRRPRREPPVG